MAGPDYFRPEPAKMKITRHDGLGYSLSLTNLVPNVDTVLYPAGHGVMQTAWRQSDGSGTVNRDFSMAFDNLDSDVEQFKPAVSELGHCHGAGANVMYLGDHGYSLIWPPELGTPPFQSGHGDKVVRVEWGPHTVFVPPLKLFPPTLQSEQDRRVVPESRRFRQPCTDDVFPCYVPGMSNSHRLSGRGSTNPQNLRSGVHKERSAIEYPSIHLAQQRGKEETQVTRR